MKRVLVTGSSRGIGHAVAKMYKDQGHYVIGLSTNLPSIGNNVCHDHIVGDLSDDKSVEEICQVVQNLNIDILINNAGINIINNFCDIKLKDFLSVQQVNVVAPFRLSQSVLPNMKSNNWGRIISISSVWGKKSKQGRASYSASKFGIDGLTLAMANEFAKHNILCNSVAPGFIDTDMTRKNLGPEGIAKMLLSIPAGRLATVDEVAKFIVWLGSDQNTYISGQNIAIDGGFTRA